MFVKRAVGVGLLALTGVAVAQQGFRASSVNQAAVPGPNENRIVGRMYTDDDLGALRDAAAAVNAEVRIARKPSPKTRTAQLEIFDDATGRLIVKVNDEHQALLQGDGTLLSVANHDLDPVQRVFTRFGLTVRPAVTKEPERLIALQQRAAAQSGKGQPWLAGMLIVEGPPASLLAAARALNDLDAVEWVEVETKRNPGVPQACCTPDGECFDVEPSECQAIYNGTPQGPGSVCGGDVCGACCRSTGICSFWTETKCANDGGSFQGAAIPCEGDTCDTGACCLTDFTCLVATEAVCRATPGFLGWSPTADDCGDSGQCGACCFGEEGSGTCAEQNEVDCEARSDFLIFVAGQPCGDGSICADLEPDCGVAGTGDCFDPDGNGNPFCNNEDCCTLVCDFDPFCCDVEDPFASWDSLCSAQARQFCQGGDRCASPINGSCFESDICDAGGRQVGCEEEACCNTVCSADAFCCDDSVGCWDADCVQLALELCEQPPAGPATPDYEPLQGYRTVGAYNPVPIELAPFLPVASGQPFYGYTGEGFNLMGGEPFEDLDDSGTWDPGEPFTDWNGNGVFDAGDPYGGLYGLGQQLLEEFGIDSTGQGNLTLGKTIKVAVIEWGYWEDHEDLDVITEPGQTIIDIPAVSAPDHGTACLSIINAIPNAIGMTGIAPEAQAYFFPLTSVEEGPREFNAWTSALETLGPGDVISCSYGPGPAIGNINNSLGTWTMIRMASDIGITCCVAAGNACFNLDGAPDLTDSGGMVVGASSPGFPWYRMVFSNFYQQEDAFMERSNIVHVRAWGTAIASAGYGVLYNGQPEPDRSYTPVFGGTSGATPQIAGAVACLQGLAKQFYGITLTPEQIRSALGAPGLTPSPCRRSWLDCGFTGNCGWDLNPDEGPNLIGPYPSLAGSFGSAASAILNQSFLGFADNPLVDQIQILVGTLVYGNVFSIKASDNNHLVVSSGLTTPGGSGVSKRGDIISGNITDVLITAHTEFDDVDNLTISADSFVTGGAGIMLLYIYSWEYNRWLVGGIAVMGDPDNPPSFPIGNASQFIRNGNRKVLFRIQTVSSAFGPTYEVWHDRIGLFAGGNPQAPSDGP
jgi:subtilisin family serine protease